VGALETMRLAGGVEKSSVWMLTGCRALVLENRAVQRPL